MQPRQAANPKPCSNLQSRPNPNPWQTPQPRSESSPRPSPKQRITRRRSSQLRRNRNRSPHSNPGHRLASLQTQEDCSATQAPRTLSAHPIPTPTTLQTQVDYSGDHSSVLPHRLASREDSSAANLSCPVRKPRSAVTCFDPGRILELQELTCLHALEEINAQHGLSFQQKGVLMKEYLGKVGYPQFRF